jgi:uncharacterized protein (TIGR00369 family)
MSTTSFIVRNPNYRQTILAHLERQRFMHHIGCILTTIEPGHVIAEIALDTIHEQQLGLVHGGVTATIADVAAGFAAFTLVAPHQHTVTAEIKISYFAKGLRGTLRAIGRVVKAGRRVHFCEADVYCHHPDGTVTHIARATTTMAVIDVHAPTAEHAPATAEQQ